MLGKKTEIFNSVKDYKRFVEANQHIKIISVNTVYENCILLTYIEKLSMNIERIVVGDQVTYFDTVSYIFKLNQGNDYYKYKTIQGNTLKVLGEFTVEIDGKTIEFDKKIECIKVGTFID